MPRMSGKSDALGIAVVGYGQIARSHTRIMKGEGHALRWLIGRVPEKTQAFAQEHGFARHSTSLDDALSDPETDAVILCTPSEQHEDQTDACLRAGKHVLVEIPLAMTFQGGRRLAALARETGLTVMVAHTHRYQGAMQRAKELVASGALTLHSVVARYMFLRRENVGANGYVRSWTDNLLWHHGCHAVDAALWLLGVPERDETVVTVAQVALPGADLAIPMDLSLTMRTARDQLVTVAMSYHTHIPVHDYLVIGEERTLVFADGRLRDNERLLLEVAHTDPANIDSPIARQDAEFFAAIREEREPAVSGRSVRPAMAALQTAQDTLDARQAALGRGARHPRQP